MEPSKEVLKTRLNTIYRAKAILDQYVLNVLKHSPCSEEHRTKCHQMLASCFQEVQPLLEQVDVITGHSAQRKDVFAPVEVVMHLLTSQFFFDVRPLMDRILQAYEEKLLPFVAQLNISPQDTVRFYQMKFVQ